MSLPYRCVRFVAFAMAWTLAACPAVLPGDDGIRFACRHDRECPANQVCRDRVCTAQPGSDRGNAQPVEGAIDASAASDGRRDASMLDSAVRDRVAVDTSVPRDATRRDMTTAGDSGASDLIETDTARDGSAPVDAGSADAGSCADAGPFPTGRIGPAIAARRTCSVSIDGDLVEWAMADAVLVAPSVVTSTGGYNWGVTDDRDLNAAVALLWDDRNLYVAARVTDDDHTVDNRTEGELWYFEDSVDLFFDLDRDRSGNQFLDGDSVFAFVADPSQPTAARWWRQGHDTGKIEVPAPPDVQAAVRVGGTNYDLEAVIPLSVLRVNDPALTFPATIGFTILITDPDLSTPGQVHQVMWVGNGDDQATWGVMTME